MSKAQNEIEEFIYKICYRPIWESVNNYIAVHPTALNLSMSRIKYPDTALLLDMLLEYATHIRIDEDSLFFDAILSCTIELQQFDEYRGEMSGETSQWLIASCEAVIKDKLDSLKVSSVKPWSRDSKPSGNGIAASKSIVPIIARKDLDKEATAFLEKYYPEALVEPMRVPIEDIAKEKLHLNVVQGYRITDDFSIFGQICFSPGKVKIYDLFKTSEKEEEVPRGTILIDAYTYWQRNSGCVNNTIAHEVYHWHRHRLYAAIKSILRNERFIACRCPADMVYPIESEEWTDEQRMEWQANNLAPRILMPIETFKTKVDELYQQYNYEDTPLKLAVLTCIADDLARFYGVSRQSALIRMTETGYPEAKSVLQAINEKEWTFSMSTAPMAISASSLTPADSNMLMDMLSSTTKSISPLMKPERQLLPSMPGTISMNAPCPLAGSGYVVHPQKKFFLRSYSIAKMMSRTYPNMMLIIILQSYNYRRIFSAEIRTLKKTRKYICSLLQTRTVGNISLKSSTSKVSAKLISAL